MHNLKELKIWHKSIGLAANIYNATSKFPKEETYGLTSQMRRAAVSITSKIALGAGRNSDNEFVHFLGISNGSSYELQSQLIISNKLNLVSESILKPLLHAIDELQKMNYSLQNILKGKS